MVQPTIYKVNGAAQREDVLLQIGQKNWLLIFGHNKSDGEENGWHWRKNYDHEPTLSELKEDIAAMIDEYDTSEYVNSFYLNGNKLWLSKDMRVGLMNSTTIEKAAGKTESVLWFNGSSITIPCDTAIQMLQALELYALECYNVTAKNKAAIAEATSIDELLGFDYTSDYPEKLSL